MWWKIPHVVERNTISTWGELGANGTAIEGDWDKVFKCVKKCHKKIHSKGAPRIYTTMKVNTRTDKEQKFSDKVKSVLEK